MKKIKEKLKQYIQKKIRYINDLFADYLVDRFSYVNRAEHLTNWALNSSEQGISNEKYCDSEIIVSLTTYGTRLYEVYLAIESIMQQSMKPNRIVLWLGDNLRDMEIPITLQKQQKRGLEIRFCRDTRSYKKLIPALASFPSATIITIDDDHLYHFDLVENFVNAHRKNHDLIYCAYMHRMKLKKNKNPEKYAKWSKHPYFDISPLNFPRGAGGILYPPHCFNQEVFNEKVFTDICNYADDVWFKAMALLNGVMSQKIFTHNSLRNNNAQYTSLSLINVDKGMNDVQLKAVFDKYNLYDKLVNTDQ